MASQGPLFPGTVTTEIGPSGDNDWANPGNIGANDGAEAQITAATYDANDHSYRLKAQNFGFSVSGTIDGIVVEIEQRRFAGAAEDQEVRLYNGAGALVGDDKQTATAWPATATIATYGGAADTWNAALTDADVNDPDFGVAHIVLATAANTDIGVDFIRVTVHYTTVPVVVTPSTATLALTPFIPTVSLPKMVTPGVASLNLSALVPTVTVTANVTVTPGVASLTTVGFAPTVVTPRLVTVGAVSLATAAFVPTVSVSDNKTVTPSTAVLTAATFAPTVTVGAGVTVTPSTAALVSVGLAPIVVASDHQTVVPATVSLTLTTFAPYIGGSVGVTPGTLVLALAAFAPTVSVTGAGITVTPGMLALILTTFAPTLPASSGIPPRGVV